METPAKPAEETDYAALVRNADVIYFPTDRAASGVRSEPASLLLEALERSGQPFAVGWDLIDASQQPLLDQIPSTVDAAREGLVRQLNLTGSGRAREHCLSVLRDQHVPGMCHLALRFPVGLIAKLAAAEPLTAEEARLIPRGYAPPPGGLESFAERLRTRQQGERSIEKAYRLQLVRQQFAAEKIVRQLRGADGNKLLVFLSASDSETGDGVPYYVPQKARVRQLVFGSPGQERARLLTWNGRTIFQVENRAPVTASD